MAYEGPQIKLHGLTANADLSAKKYYYVKLVGADLVDVCQRRDGHSDRRAAEQPISGMPAEVCALGETRSWRALPLRPVPKLHQRANDRAAYVPGTDDQADHWQMVTATGAANGIGTAVINLSTGAWR